MGFEWLFTIMLMVVIVGGAAVFVFGGERDVGSLSSELSREVVADERHIEIATPELASKREQGPGHTRPSVTRVRR